MLFILSIIRKLIGLYESKPIYGDKIVKTIFYPKDGMVSDIITMKKYTTTEKRRIYKKGRIFVSSVDQNLINKIEFDESFINHDEIEWKNNAGWFYIDIFTENISIHINKDTILPNPVKCVTLFGYEEL